MMRSGRSIALVAAVLCLTVQATFARIDIKIDFDKSFDFTAVRSWGWSPTGYGQVKLARTASDDPEAMTKYAEPIIVDAVTTEMGNRGLRQAPSEPDAFVAYFLLLTTGAQAQTMGQFLPPTMEWGLPYFPQSTQSLRIMNQGALVLDVSAKGAVVWRGVARAEIKMDANEKKRETLVRTAVRDLLRRYPPKQ